MERSSKVGWLVIVFRNGWVERSSGVGWLAIRGAVIISWMARDQCPGWLVERSSGVGWLVISVLVEHCHISRSIGVGSKLTNVSVSVSSL